jgi:hypothetical protein
MSRIISILMLSVCLATGQDQRQFADWFAAAVSGGPSDFTTGLQAWWKLNESSGTNVTDSAGSFSGTIPASTTVSNIGNPSVDVALAFYYGPSYNCGNYAYYYSYAVYADSNGVFSTSPALFSGYDDGNYDQTAALYFSWLAVSGATSYRVVVLEDGCQGSTPGIYFDTTDQSVTISGGYDSVSGQSYGTEVWTPPTGIVGPSWVSGKAGNALSFPGSTYATTTLSNLASPCGTITWWQNPALAWGDSTRSALVHQFNTDLGTAFGALFQTDGKWYVGWYLGSGQDKRVVLQGSSSNWKTNEWHMYSFTWTPTVACTFSLDCVPLATNTSSLTATNIGFPLTIGGLWLMPLVADYYFTGSIDDVRYYTNALTLNELSNVFLNPR